MKKNKVLGAKILIVLILLLTIGLGLLTLVDYLSKPKTMFYSAIEELYDDFSDIADTINNKDLYKLLNSDKVTIDADTKINVSGLLTSSYKKYQSPINSSSFINNIEIDKKNKCISNELNVNRDNIERLNISYVDSKFQRFIKRREIEDNYFKLEKDKINVEFLETDKTLAFTDILRVELLNILIDENFENSKETIGINGITINTVVSTYELSGIEFSTLLDKIITSIETNNEIRGFIANLFGIEENSVRTNLQSLKTEIEVDFNSTVIFKVYTKSDTDESLKFSIIKRDENNIEQELISYVKYMKYHAIDFMETSSLELNGDLNKEYELTLNKDGYRIILKTSTDKEENNGTLDIYNLNKGKKLISGTFTHMYKNTSINVGSISLTGNFEWIVDNETANIELNSSILINKNVDIQVKNVVAKDLAEDLINADFKTVMDGFLHLLETHCTESIQETETVDAE